MWPRAVNYSFTPVLQNSSSSNLFPPVFQKCFFLVDAAGNYDATDTCACLSVVYKKNNGGNCVLVSQYEALCHKKRTNFPSAVRQQTTDRPLYSASQFWCYFLLACWQKTPTCWRRLTEDVCVHAEVKYQCWNLCAGFPWIASTWVTIHKLQLLLAGKSITKLFSGRFSTGHMERE